MLSRASREWPLAGSIEKKGACSPPCECDRPSRSMDAQGDDASASPSALADERDEHYGGVGRSDLGGVQTPPGRPTPAPNGEAGRRARRRSHGGRNRTVAPA